MLLTWKTFCKPLVLKLLLSEEQYYTCLESITEGRGGEMRIREIISVVTVQTIFLYSYILLENDFTQISLLHIKDGNNTL